MKGKKDKIVSKKRAGIHVVGKYGVLRIVGEDSDEDFYLTAEQLGWLSEQFAWAKKCVESAPE